MSITRRAFLSLALAVLAFLSASTRRLNAAPPADAPAASLTIAAASDLKFAMDELIGAFKQARTDIDVTVTYGSSGNFFAQLNNGAPFDLFFSADSSYPKQLAEQGLVLEGSPFQYAEGRIVVWVPNASTIDVRSLGIQALLAPAAKKVAIANPKHAPYGRAAEAAMKRLGVYDAVKDRLVFGENISQTAHFVQSGAADIGIIALSLAIAPAMKSEGRYWEIPSSAHPKLEQTAVILKRTRSPEAAQAFKAFVMGPQGRRILKRYGFVLPGENVL